ncbi:hypothetical protein [Pengzhenrongella sicca]|uniref:Uncharacterized protein n=1 Tax=Pengzhenrongella sicca TaxID=2819238 RepID=A0A8A4ZGH8_9MICO|nr:hypothetical protein [Pengzhenrongella sicca]QTE30053.1 hypothetical protein J4E96_03240 [Pengzhenrongella sicca]
MIAADRHLGRSHNRAVKEQLIDAVGSAVPRALQEDTNLGRTLKKRAGDVLAIFDRADETHRGQRLHSKLSAQSLGAFGR